MMTSSYHVHSIHPLSLQARSNSAENNLFPIRQFMFISKQVDRKRLAFVRKPNNASSSRGVGIYIYIYCHFGVFPQLLDQNCPWQIWESFVPWAVGSVLLNYVLQQYSLDSDNFCTHCHMTVPMGFCMVAVSLIFPMGWNVLWVCLGERKLFCNTVY